MPITVRRAHVERGLPLASLAEMQAGKSKAIKLCQTKSNLTPGMLLRSGSCPLSPLN
jgi:hypothetical protein